jgi:hypothetical protein
LVMIWTTSRISTDWYCLLSLVAESTAWLFVPYHPFGDVATYMIFGSQSFIQEGYSVVTSSFRWQGCGCWENILEFFKTL